MTAEERIEKPADPSLEEEHEEEHEEYEIQEENPVHLGINNSKKLLIKPFRPRAGRFSPLSPPLSLRHGGKRSTKRRTQRKRK